MEEAMDDVMEWTSSNEPKLQPTGHQRDHSVLRLRPHKMKPLDKIFQNAFPDSDNQVIKYADIIIPTKPLASCPEIGVWVIEELPISIVKFEFYKQFILNKIICGIQKGVTTLIREYDPNRPELGSSVVPMKGNHSFKRNRAKRVALKSTDGRVVDFQVYGLAVLPFFIRGLPMKATVLLVEDTMPRAFDQNEVPPVLLSHEPFRQCGVDNLLKIYELPKGLCRVDFTGAKKYTGNLTINMNVCAWAFPKTRQHKKIPDRYGYGVYCGRNSAYNHLQKCEPDPNLSLTDNLHVTELHGVIHALKLVLAFRHVVGLWFKKVDLTITSHDRYIKNNINSQRPPDFIKLWRKVQCLGILVSRMPGGDGGVSLDIVHREKMANERREAGALAQKAATGARRRGTPLAVKTEGDARKEMMRATNYYEFTEQNWEIFDAGTCSSMGLPDGIKVLAPTC